MKLLRRPARAGLPERLDALAAAVEDGDGRLPAELLDTVRRTVERAGQRGLVRPAGVLLGVHPAVV